MTFAIDPALLIAFSLALVRAIAFLVTAPPFNTRMIPIVVKAGIAAALAVAAAPMIAKDPVPTDTGPFLIALVTSAFVGFALGFLTVMLVNALQAAGGLVDLFAGFSLAAIIDPSSGSEVAVFGRLYQLIAVTLLFATNGYLLLVNGWFRSFDIIPASGLAMDDLSQLLTQNLGQFFLAAVEIAAPVLGCLFLSEVGLGLLSRAAPQLNVFSLAFPLRVVVALLVVGLAIPLLGPAVGNLVTEALGPLAGR